MLHFNTLFGIDRADRDDSGQKNSAAADFQHNGRLAGQLQGRNPG